jgi:hypothetical protein
VRQDNAKSLAVTELSGRQPLHQHLWSTEREMKGCVPFCDAQSQKGVVCHFGQAAAAQPARRLLCLHDGPFLGLGSFGCRHYASCSSMHHSLSSKTVVHHRDEFLAPQPSADRSRFLIPVTRVKLSRAPAYGDHVMSTSAIAQTLWSLLAEDHATHHIHFNRMHHLQQRFAI